MQKASNYTSGSNSNDWLVFYLLNVAKSLLYSTSMTTKKFILFDPRAQDVCFSTSSTICTASFFFFCFLGLHPWHYESSQARGQIGATAASLHHSPNNLGSQPCLRPTPQFTATWGQGLNLCPHGSLSGSLTTEPWRELPPSFFYFSFPSSSASG